MTDHRITTTMQPDRVVTVSDTELHDLERMNVVASRLDDQPTTETTQQEAVHDGSGQEEGQPEADGGQAPEAQGQRLRTTG